VLALTTYEGDADIFRALEAGARGYLLKHMLLTEAISAIRAVYGGARVIPPAGDGGPAHEGEDELKRPGVDIRQPCPQIGWREDETSMCLAIPGRIVELLTDPPVHLAMVDVSGVRRRVDLGLLQDDLPAVGDWVLIHVGFAMSRISESEAENQMRMLAVLGEDAAAMEEVRGYGLEGRDP
jgi:hydrogenase expression/formation protein HypC